MRKHKHMDVSLQYEDIPTKHMSSMPQRVDNYGKHVIIVMILSC